MTDYPTTWWEWTGRYTKFEDGIASPIYKRQGAEEEKTSRDLPAGALYLAPPGSRQNAGYDGQGVYCVLPDGQHWYIDGRANNCDMPNDNEHRCWIRHGGFGEAVTVDKNGKTCGAGGGSIQTSKFHGHLKNGVLSG